MSDEGTKPSQPPEGQSLWNVGAVYWLGRRLGVWLTGDPYADLALAAIREREHMALLEDEPRYGDNEARPAEPTTTADAAQNDPPPRPPESTNSGGNATRLSVREDGFIG
jgi:hypothetical protein